MQGQAVGAEERTLNYCSAKQQGHATAALHDAYCLWGCWRDTHTHTKGIVQGRGGECSRVMIWEYSSENEHVINTAARMDWLFGLIMISSWKEEERVVPSSGSRTFPRIHSSQCPDQCPRHASPMNSAMLMSTSLPQ